MATSIWKFTLTELMQVSMPTGARILHVHEQNAVMRLWAVVDPAKDREIRRFHVVGTGHPIPEKIGAYIGTVHMRGGELVFHIFEAA